MKKIFLSIIVVVIILVAGIIWRLSVNSKNGLTLPSSENQENIKGNLVEVFYLPHPPVVPVRDKIKEILQKFPKYRLEEYSFEEAGNKAKIKSHNLTGHIPVVIFVNGKNVFSIEGRKVTLRNFPKSDAFVPTFSGSWDYSDLEKILSQEK